MLMEDVLLIRYSEIHLKGLNRPFFERKLIEGIKRALNNHKVYVIREQGRIYVKGLRQCETDEAIDKLKRVFGIHSVSRAKVFKKDWDTICAGVTGMVERLLNERDCATFKVAARRSDKQFPLNSDQINRKLGELLLSRFSKLKVDVHDPDFIIGVEVRDEVYVYTGETGCSGGMPTGTAGRVVLLISGGIDSPAAGFMLAKRGAELSAVHFYSFPYTSERAKDKVIELTRLLSLYAGTIKLHLVPFTEIQTAVYEKCPSKETTVLMRRQMMKIAEMIAHEDGAKALVTGESLGQVASQTLESLAATDDAVKIPVFRPLIGFDKDDIMDLARKIGTYETSILPYEDCCTVFVPRHPVTRPSVDSVRASESAADFEDLNVHALAEREILNIG
ncbi:MAG: putative tRNA sulfurtransferase [Firmicutes bacterium ADurb.Bin182]|nr:MAG: putative tRNA sulfurtransferase [Firmicutes bacterium ADurb.Bin182]